MGAVIPAIPIAAQVIGGVASTALAAKSVYDTVKGPRSIPPGPSDPGDDPNDHLHGISDTVEDGLARYLGYVARRLPAFAAGQVDNLRSAFEDREKVRRENMSYQQNQRRGKYGTS